MSGSGPVVITARDNPLVKELRKLAQDGAAYRRLCRVWLEGDHLCRAALARGWTPSIGVFGASFFAQAPAQWTAAALRTVVLADALLPLVSSLESPASMGFVIDLPVADAAMVRPGVATVVLDRLQDPGNAGSILRSAAAFGVQQVLALKGTVALWSPKVLRAGMGAHFALHLVEGAVPEAVDGLDVPLVATSSHEGEFLHRAQRNGTLPEPCAWLLGHEGQGVSPALEARAALRIRIAQPGGEESLNVAAAAAICLHASAVAW